MDSSKDLYIDAALLNLVAKYTPDELRNIDIPGAST